MNKREGQHGQQPLYPRVSLRNRDSGMKDADIRPVLHRQLSRKYRNRADTAVVNELGIYSGSFRVDVAVVNGILGGFEIKSEKDTLSRLPNQASAYGDVFDYMTLVASERHIDKALAIIPEWWGINVACETAQGIKLTDLRKGSTNLHTKPDVVVALLWRHEALNILTSKRLDKGLRTAPKDRLWDALVQSLDPDDLKAEVRTAIRNRLSVVAALDHDRLHFPARAD